MSPHKMNRRSFLKATLVGSVAMGTAPVLAACVSPSAQTESTDVVSLRMWGNHPGWKDPLREALGFSFRREKVQTYPGSFQVRFWMSFSRMDTSST